MTKENEKLRENLAQNLNSEEKIKSFLRKDRLSNFKLLQMAYAPFKDNLKIKLSLLIYPFVNGLIPVLQAFIMYFLVELINNKTDLRTMILIITAYSLIIFAFSLISKQIERRTYPTYMDTRLNLFVKAQNLL